MPWVVVILAVLWCGFTLAISFMEAVVKFRAPSLTRSVGLDVGRYVFRALNRVEMILGSVLFMLGTGMRLGMARSILLLQTFWLLPAMNQRAEQYISGHAPPRSRIHLAYVALEVLKLAGVISLVGFQVTEHL